MEARDASGNLVATEHAEVLTTAGWMLAAMGVVALGGIAIVAAGINIPTGWLAVLVAILGVVVALLAAGSLGFFLWGKQVGFSWHFTP